MSLIAEALRKSEAERQLGKPPGMTTSPLWSQHSLRRKHDRNARRRRILVVSVLLTAGVVGGLLIANRMGLLQYASPGQPLTAETAPSRTVQPAAPRQAAAAIETAPLAPAVASSARTAVAHGAADPASDSRSTAPVSAPVPAIEREAIRLPAADAAGDSRLGTQAPAGSPAKAAQPADATAVSAPPSVAPRVDTATSSNEEPALNAGSPQLPSARNEPLVALLQLPDSQRREIPELKLNMHVYAADPQRRFVLLNGTRMTEGESTPQGVSVVEIRDDGAVLEFRSIRFLLPR